MSYEREYYVYIMASRSGVLYIGVTNNLQRRVEEHRKGHVKGFTQKYRCTLLFYFEQTQDIMVAIEREKQLKRWRREKKITLIKTLNPTFVDLYPDLFRPHLLSFRPKRSGVEKS